MEAEAEVVEVDALKGERERKKKERERKEGAKKDGDAEEDRCGKWEAPAMAPRAVIGRFEEDETSGRTARAGRVAGLHWRGGKGIAHGHMGTRSVRSIVANSVGFVLDPGGQRWRFCLCFRAG